jgi:hypothetical protein
MADTSDTLDELPPHTRHVLSMLDGMVTTVCAEQKIERADYRFTRREARERLGIGNTQAKIHLRRLVEAEYVIVHGAKHGRGVVYGLACTYDADRSALEGDRSGDGRPMVGPRSAQGRGVETSTAPEETCPTEPDRSGSPGTKNRGQDSAERRTSATNGAGR